MLKTSSNSKRLVQISEIPAYILFSTQCSFQFIMAFPPFFTIVIVMDNFKKKSCSWDFREVNMLL